MDEYNKLKHTIEVGDPVGVLVGVYTVLDVEVVAILAASDTYFREGKINKHRSNRSSPD